ncbi:hypothetical protein ACFB49_42500 [Sphingomonas sp. DBB INV C78]|uniref:hypothetical protein n=1 Tax=Sphingomonas sp. DBB INV C78 TaxID=3349434 RepID=UPI0036D3CA1A
MAADIIARLQLSGAQFSSENARLFGELEARARDTAGRTKTSFERSFGEIQRIAKDALTMPRTDFGSLDVGASKYREAASAAQNQATALREVETAARRAADAAGDTSEQTRLYIQAANAAANEAEESARAYTVEANALERLQGELNQTASRTAVVANANRVSGQEARNHQLAMRNLGFQVSDVGASFASGAPLVTIFGQQIGQVGGALSDMQGKAGALGRFLTNPWVAALTTAGIVVSVFASKLDEAGEAANAAKVGADGLSEAQGVLGKMFDLASGKIEKQNELLVLNARLTAINLRAEAAASKSSAQDTFRQSGSESVLGATGTFFARGYGSSPQQRMEQLNARAAEQRRYLLAVQNATTEDARQKAGDAALKYSENADFSGLKVGKTEFQQAIVDYAAGRAKDQIADLIDQSLDGKSLATELRRPGRDRKGPKAPSTTARDEFGRDANDRIAAIADRFSGAPSQVQLVNKAVAQLDDLMEDLARRKPPGFEATIASAQEAKQVVEDSLLRPLQDYKDAQAESAEIGKLLAQGRYVEADALSEIYRLQKMMGPLTKGQADDVYKIAEQNERIARAIEDQRRQLNIYLSAVGDAQRTFEDFLVTLDRKPKQAFKNLFDDLRANFRNLQVRIISEKLFGGLERELEEFLTGRKGPQAAIDLLGTEATRASGAFSDVADAAATTAERLLAISGGTGAGAPTALPSGRFGSSIFDGDTGSADLAAILGDAEVMAGLVKEVVANGDIIVTGQKEAADGARKAANDNARAAKKMVSAVDTIGFINDRFAERLQALIGTQLPATLSNVLAGALTGYAAGGEVGGVLGALKGIKGVPEKLDKIFGQSGALDGALKGAQTGTIIAGLGKSLGLKTSTAGSQIGGALGSLTGIPGGDIIGSIAGGLIGGALKKTKKGTATIGFSDGELAVTGTSGNSKKFKAAASGTASNVIEGLNQIASMLGGTLSGSPSVSIGVRDGDYRVDPTGRGMTKKKNGAIDFGDDAEAAVRYAIGDALKDGVIGGISDASKRILQSGKDLDKAIEKAVAIEAIPKLLRQRLDPLGFALDELDAKWKTTVAALREGGATARQMADAQKLYNLELEDVKANTAAASATLKDFLTGLSIGGNSPLSLRDQESAARAQLQPFLDKIAAGDTINQDAYRAAAESFLEIERQLYGSTSEFFAEFERIQAATAKAIEKIDNAQSIRPETDIFVQQTATATQATANIAAQQTDQLSNIQGLLAQILAASKGGGNPFGIDGRLFTSAA